MNKILVIVYAIFALSASARAAVQIASAFDEAPLAYSLSALAGLVYLVAAVALARPGRTARRVAVASLTFELLGVLAVGTAGLITPESFPDETVWSVYGRGYGFVPLVLPVVGLAWAAFSPAPDSVAQIRSAGSFGVAGDFGGSPSQAERRAINSTPSSGRGRRMRRH